MSPTVYLVSGANRGIGLGLVKALAARPDTLVFAGARNPAGATELRALADERQNVHVLQLTSADEADNRAAVAEIERVVGALHVVIANAGISNHLATVLDVPPKAMLEHFEVNVNGPLVLFQSTYPLLRASTPAPKFVAVSSVAGSIAAGAPSPFRGTAYGASKAALNFVVRKLRAENAGLVAFAVCPGGVATDMADWTLRNDETGLLKALQAHVKTVDEAAAQLLGVVDAATRETDVFMKADGGTYPW